MNLRTSVRSARAAVVFLTRIPVGGFPYSPAEHAAAGAWFPVVGAGLGVVLVGVWELARPLDPLVAATCVLTAHLFLTGAIHEDALADTADALGDARDRERLLTILKDPRVGTYGVAAIVLSLLLRATLLGALEPVAPTAIVLSQTLSRSTPVWPLATLPYVTPEAVARSRAVARAGRWEAVIATAWGVAVLAAAVTTTRLTAATAGIMLVTLIASTWYLGWRFLRRAGGITGDFAGAVQQVSEILILVVLAASQT